MWSRIETLLILGRKLFQNFLCFSCELNCSICTYSGTIRVLLSTRNPSCWLKTAEYHDKFSDRLRFLWRWLCNTIHSCVPNPSSAWGAWKNEPFIFLFYLCEPALRLIKSCDVIITECMYRNCWVCFLLQQYGTEIYYFHLSCDHSCTPNELETKHYTTPCGATEVENGVYSWRCSL